MRPGLCERTARAVDGDPCHVLLAGILLLILDGDQRAIRFSAAKGMPRSLLCAELERLARSVR